MRRVTWQLLGSSRYRVLKTSLKKVGWYLQARSQSGLKFTSRICGCITRFPDGTKHRASYSWEGGLVSRAWNSALLASKAPGPKPAP